MQNWLFGEDAYDPAREAQFAQLLSGGMGGSTDNVGSALMNLIPMLLGSYGLERQGKARDTEMQAGAQQEGESLARVLAGLGIEADPATASTIAGNKDLMQEILERSRPPEPVEATPEKMFGSARQYSLGDESQWARGPSERDALCGTKATGRTKNRPLTRNLSRKRHSPRSLSKATGPDGKEYWVDTEESY